MFFFFMLSNNALEGNTYKGASLKINKNKERNKIK